MNLLTTTQYKELRKELRKAFTDMEHVTLHGLRINVREMILSGEHKLVTIVPYLRGLAIDVIDNIDLDLLVKPNDSHISLQNLQVSIETYLVNYAMRLARLS